MCGRRGPDAIGARAAYTSHPLPSTGPEKVCTPRISIAGKYTSVRLLYCCPDPATGSQQSAHSPGPEARREEEKF